MRVKKPKRTHCAGTHSRKIGHCVVLSDFVYFPEGWTLPAHSGQMHCCPRACKVSEASTAGAMSAAMHQQKAAGLPCAMAHWLDWPHRGQAASSAFKGSMESMKASVDRRCAKPAHLYQPAEGSGQKNGAQGAICIEICLQRMLDMRWQLSIKEHQHRAEDF